MGNIHRIHTPYLGDPDLAYLVGVLAGDGSINIRSKKHDYEIKCVGNPKNEKDFYCLVIAPLFEKLFGLKTRAKLYDSGTTYGIRIWSKSLVEFFKRIGVPTGKKYKWLRIPHQFKKSDKLIKAYICGLADTDFSLALKRRYKRRRYYPVISGVSKSRKLMEEVAKYLEKWGFSVSRHFKVRNDKRFGKFTTHVIQLYGHKQLVKWMHLIGFRNPKHLRKFEHWINANKNNKRARLSLERIAGPGFEPGTSRAHVSTQASPGPSGAPNSRLDAL
jgi:intein/homing endonuclease